MQGKKLNLDVLTFKFCLLFEQNVEVKKEGKNNPNRALNHDKVKKCNYRQYYVVVVMGSSNIGYRIMK